MLYCIHIPSTVEPNHVLLRSYRKLLKNDVVEKWHTTRDPADKLVFNCVVRELKYGLKTDKENSIQQYLSYLAHSQATEYSLWKATRHFRTPLHHMPPIQNGNNSRCAKTDTE